MKALIIYHTKYGQTEKIARRISAALESKQLAVELYHVDAIGRDMSLDGFQLTVLAAPIYLGKHTKKLTKFVKRHIDALKAMTSAFVSVSMSAAGGQKQRDEAMGCVKKFLAKTNWDPTFVQLVPGCLDYKKYNWFIRWAMKRIAKANNGHTDTSKNHEYTNWEEVDEFAVKLFDSIENPISRGHALRETQETSASIE